MMGRFLKQSEMANVRHEQEVFNSRLKRGEIKDPDLIAREHMVVCGCGALGCIFISCQRREKPQEANEIT